MNPNQPNEKRHTLPLKFSPQGDVALTRIEGDGYTYLNIALDNQGDQTTLLKLEESADYGLRLMVYTTPDVEEPLILSLRNYREDNNLDLNAHQRETAEAKTLSQWSDDDRNIEQILLNGTVGIKNLSDRELMDELAYDDEEIDVNTFKERLM